MRLPLRMSALLCVSACAPHLSDADRKNQLEASLAAIAPTAEPAAPREWPANGIPEFNTEYWLGTEAEEAALIKGFGEQIQALQHEMAQQHGTAPLRGFHAKSHGCLKGELKLRGDRDPRVRFGVLSDAYTTWPIIVRYSNGVGWAQADDELDARGLGLKILGVPGTKYLPDEQQTQDFLMTNSPTPIGKNAIEFMEFAHANIKGRIAGLGFLLGHLKTASALTRTGAIDSTLNETYWSGGPAHLGAHQAVKYSVAPCSNQAKRAPKHEGADYLAADLAAAAKEGACATLKVQFQADPIDMPIEDSSVVWDEKVSVPVAVADLVLPPQSLMDQKICDELVFHPWHAIAEHKPMGNHNRARKVVYSASQALRAKGTEPLAQPAAPMPASETGR